MPKTYFSFPLCEAGARCSTSAPFPKEEMSMTSSWQTFQKSQGLTSLLCTPSMVWNTSSDQRPSIHAQACQLPPDRLASGKSEFLKMDAMGIIHRSNSPWASPLHMVPKASNGWCPCGDYRHLNKVTIPDHYPVPHIEDFSANLANVQVFSKIDLVN